MFHRMPMPLESVRHFDMLHPARRLWRDARTGRDSGPTDDGGGCRLGTLERVLCDVDARRRRARAWTSPARYFRFLRSGDARPLEPVLEHNRLDLISLAAVAAHAVQLVEEGSGAVPRCRRGARARQGLRARRLDRSGARRATTRGRRRSAARRRRGRRRSTGSGVAAAPRSPVRRRRGCLAADPDVEGPGRTAADRLLATRRSNTPIEALAIHHEHRERDYEGAQRTGAAAAGRRDVRPTGSRASSPGAAEQEDRQ